MSTQPQLIGTGIVVVAGRWAQGKPLDIKIGIGLGVYALALAAITAGNPKLASQFSTLVLVSALFLFAIPVSDKLGLLKK